ncbi:MAG: serine protease, partial [Kitasatospora sp.]|nr:serine protease [Kitasatospora sp.]
MTDTDVDIQRVAMVLRVEADGARRPVGSGYLLSDGVVLTAGHVIKPEAAEYQLRFFGDRPDVPVRRRTRHPGLDVALLHHRRLGNDLPPVVLGRLPRGSGELPVRGIGFPEFAVDGRQVHSHSIHGEIILQSRHGDPEGLVHLRARDQPESGVGGTPWGGSSGTALFAGRALVGVFHGALPRAGSHSFLAVRADLLHERADDDFTQWLARAGVPVEPVEVAPPHKPSGHGLRWTLSHQELVEKELTEDPYLLEKHLAYVDPGLADGSAPRRLFADLRRRRTPEVLLTGGVGTGKSRTCMEVADLAAADGWTVLHALPGGEFTVQNLAEDLRAAPPGRVLLVIDHLERRRRLDFDDIQDSLRPQAARQGIELRILAALRTDRADRLGSGLDRLFREVPVRQDDAHLGAVARRIVTTVAVRAVARWGEQAVSEACGRHPVVALLGAGYIENGFLDGVSPDLTAPPRSDDLVKLLERRLRDDRFLTSTTPAPDAHAFEATPVSLPQLACAAAFAACPQPRPQVEYAVDGLLAKLAPKGTPQPPFDGRTLVDRLIGYGWLQHTGGGELDTLHDIVTDTFLRSVLVPATGLPRPEQVSALFGLHLRDRTGLTRLARHIDRLHGELTHDADRTQLSRLCADFVTERMPAIRHHLAPPQENVAAVLRTLLTSPPWLTALAAHWDTLIAPWLTGIQGSALDHWFLYDVLRQSGDRPPGLVVDAALDRLDEEAVPGRAGMLLSVLLQADGLTDARRGRLLAAVRRWLGRPLDSDPDERKAYNGFTPYVLGPALRYTDDAADWNRIVTQGLNRAGQRGGSLFLGPLLQRPQLTPGIRRLTLAAAVKWLASYSDTDAAGHVLGPLLSRTDLNRDADSRTQLGQAARHALDYVQPRIEARRARFVLAPLLRQVELTPKQATNARQTADRWLALHRADPVVADVLAALLARPDTPAELCHRAADRALTWLDDHPDRPGGGPLAEALLAAPDRLGPGQLGRVLAAARRWSAAGPESVADSPLLRLAADCETGPDGTVRRIVAEDLTDR